MDTHVFGCRAGTAALGPTLGLRLCRLRGPAYRESRRGLQGPPRRHCCPCKATGKDTSKQLPNLKDLLPNIAVQSFDTPPPDLNGDPKKPKGTNLWRKLLQELSSLPRSIAVLGMIAFLSSLGTIIEQDRPDSFYIENYPDGPVRVLGFFTYNWILNLDLDHIYTSWYFWAFLWTLVAQLVACTYTRQIPLLKVAKTWKFAEAPKSIARIENAEMLPNAKLKDLGRLLDADGYVVFVKDASLYACKGLAGRIAPIGVHISLLLALAGMAWGILGGFKGEIMVPEGNEFQIEQALSPTSFLSISPSSAKNIVHVDQFTIEYDPSGEVSQFYSDLSVYDARGEMVSFKQISVNHPIRTQGITMYQSKWGMVGLQLDAKGSPLQPEDGSKLRLKMARLIDVGVSGKVWGSFIPTGEFRENGQPVGVSVLAKDFQTVTLYDSTGKFAGVRRVESKTPIVVEGMEIVIDRIIGSTGLEVKSDPGVPLVYAGFGGIMLTTFMSYLSHSQIWALQVGSGVHVGSKTNRAVIAFRKEFSELLDKVPEVLPESPDVRIEA